MQGIDVIASKNTNSKARQNLEIRYSKAADQGSFLSGLAETVKKSVGRESKLVDLSAGRDPLTYEISPPQY